MQYIKTSELSLSPWRLDYSDQEVVQTFIMNSVNSKQIISEGKIKGIYRVSPKKEGLRILNRFDSYCLKDYLDGSKLGKNMWNAFNRYGLAIFDFDVRTP